MIKLFKYLRQPEEDIQIKVTGVQKGYTLLSNYKKMGNKLLAEAICSKNSRRILVSIIHSVIKFFINLRQPAKNI